MHTILADKTSQDYLPDSKCNEQDYVFLDLPRQNCFAPTPKAVSHAKTDKWLHGVYMKFAYVSLRPISPS